MTPCQCTASHSPKRMVLTGGPGAGKTAVLELIRQSFCSHVRVLPEAAGIIFGGGFPREHDDGCRRASQRAIFHVQRELEAAAGSHDSAIVLCDRGTIDGLAYWPGTEAEFWAGVQSSAASELSRYDVVLHLRVPGADGGYNRQNPLRIESALAAAEIDQRILAAWHDHPRRFTVNAAADFLEKVSQAIAILRDEMPACCRSHDIPELASRLQSSAERGL